MSRLLLVVFVTNILTQKNNCSHIEQSTMEIAIYAMTAEKTFKTKSNLDNHLDQVHTKLQENAQHFICPFEGCGKAFLRKQPYQFHLNKHTGVKPYTCHNCPRKFISQYRKRQHENICLGIIEIKCIRCGTKRHDNATHKGVSHICPCDKKYTQLSSLKRHQAMQGH